MTLRVMRYRPDRCEAFDARPEDLAGVLEPGAVVWVDAHGVSDHDALTRLGEAFGVHPLALADIANVGQRPKAEAYGGALFAVTRMARLTDAGAPDVEQVSLWASDGLVVTVQERAGDCLDPIRARIRTEGSRLRRSGAGYLAVMVLDAITDGYFPVLEAYGERLEEIERRLLERPDQSLLHEIFAAKRDLMAVRRSIWPQREMLASLMREGHPLIEPPVAPYLRDVADHVIQIVDITETYRELAQSYIDVYLSSVANRTNEVMRVLTVVATIFIPITFVAGVYGMNFDTSSPANMPELSWRFGYLFFWGVCAAIAAAMLLVARRLGWLGSRARG